MIELKNITKKYKNLMIFEHLNVSFPQGNKFLIAGPNGSGKSVLLKLILGYAKPNEGSVIIDKSILGKPMDFLSHSGAFINSPEFMNQWTGLENLLYIANIRKIANEREIMDLAAALNFEDDILKKYKTYSLGMKQKMRLIQALMEHPKYLILDEPFDYLDETSKEKAIELLNHFMNGRTTLIYSSNHKEDESFANIKYRIEDHQLKRIK